MSIQIEKARKSCNKCEKKAEVMVRYARLYLCREHYLDYIEKRVLKTIKEYNMFRGVRRLLLALSGGKDSLSLAFILSKYKDELGVQEIIGLHIDLGINGFSDKSRIAVENTCRELGLKCIILSLKDLVGLTLPEIAKISKRPPCSVCGLLKRYLINIIAIELGADAVVMGHHMNDILLFYLRNILLGVKLDFLKLGAVLEGKEGVVTRKLRPLYEVYEEDLLLYSKLRNITTVDTECPYKHDDYAKKAIREMLDKLESHAPGYKLSLIRRITSLVKQDATVPQEASVCKYCGSATSSNDNICAFCKLTRHVYGEPRGSYLRQKLREVLSRKE